MEDMERTRRRHRDANCLTANRGHRRAAVLKRGLFLCVDGVDGAGKSAALDAVADELGRGGRQIVMTREPGGTDLGVQVRNMILHGQHLGSHTEALLFAADRAHHVETVVRPALDAGINVVTSRYADASAVYQSASGELDEAEVWDLSMWATGGLVPDLTVLLDLDPQIGIERARQRGELDRIESKDLEFHRKVRDGFLRRARAEPQRFIVVDADQDPETVARIVHVALSQRLPERLADG